MQRRPRPARAEAGPELLAGRESAREAALRLAGRTRAPRLGASSCSAAAAASSPAARAWRLQGLGQHFPAVSHTPLRERGLWHTRTQPPTSRSLGKIKNSGIRAKGVAQEKSPTEVRRLGSPLGAAAAGGAGRRRRREANSVCPAKPLSPPSEPARLASLALTLRLGAGDSGCPSSHFRSPGRGGAAAAAPRNAEGEDSGKQGGARKSHATHSNGGEMPPNNPKEFSGQLPISLQHLCVCVCERRE